MPQLSQRNREWRGPCPIHDGKRDSLAVDPETGRAYCHSTCGLGWDIPGFEQALSGCDFPTAVQRVSGIIGRDLSSNGTQPERHIVCEYDYCDASGKLLFQVVRFDPKDFRQRRPDGHGGWIWNVKGVRQVPYRLPAVLKSERLYVAEGEKDVHSLETIGIIATTNAGGAGKWRAEYREHFRGKTVFVIPDADEPGREHAESVATSLQGVAASVRIVPMPTGKDVSDWIAAGGTAKDLHGLAAAASDYMPPLSALVETAPSQHPRAADLDGFRFTDLATAELMVKWYGRELHYSHAWHKWLAWDGKRWKVDDTGAVVRRAADTVRLLYDVAGTIKESKERERLVRHALSYEAKKKLDAMIALAASQLDIVVLPEQLDRNKWLLNVNNGTLDLRTGELREHRREDLITKLAPVRHDPEAKATLFEIFLNDIFAGNQDVIPVCPTRHRVCDHRRHFRAMPFYHVGRRRERQVHSDRNDSRAGRRLRHVHPAGNSDRQATRGNPERSGAAEGAAVRGGCGNRRGQTPCRSPHQADDRRRYDLRPVHAGGMVRLQARVQMLLSHEP